MFKLLYLLGWSSTYNDQPNGWYTPDQNWKYLGTEKRDSFDVGLIIHCAREDDAILLNLGRCLIAEVGAIDPIWYEGYVDRAR